MTFMSPAVEEVENVTNKRHTQTAHHMYTRAGRQVKNFVVHTHIHTLFICEGCYSNEESLALCALIGQTGPLFFLCSRM